MTAFSAVAGCVLFATSARAEICMFRDAEGNVTYTNVTAAAPRDAKKIRCFKSANTAPAAATAAPQPQSAGANFPSVDRDTQRERDNERRSLLEAELATEQQRLQQALRQLEEQESVRQEGEANSQQFLDRVQPFRDAVENHERNVQALQRELTNLR